MTREDLTEKILDIKRAKGWSWKHITSEMAACPKFSSSALCLVR